MQVSSEELKKWTREILLCLVVTFSLVIAIFTITWSQQPEYRPLVQDLRLADAVKIADVLEQNSVDYHADIKSHMLYVNSSQIIDAKIGLARAGIVIDYPNIKVNEDLNDSFEQLALQLNRNRLEAPYYEQEWFQPFIKTISSMVVIIMLLLSIVRPALRALIYPNGDE